MPQFDPIAEDVEGSFVWGHSMFGQAPLIEVQGLHVHVFLVVQPTTLRKWGGREGALPPYLIVKFSGIVLLKRRKHTFL